MTPAPRLGIVLLIAGIAQGGGCSPTSSSTSPAQTASVRSSEPLPQAEATAGSGGSRPKSPRKEPAPKKVSAAKGTAPTGLPRTADAFTWPGFGGPAADGISPERGLLREFPTDGPRELWRAALGTGHSGVAIAGDKAFTLYGRDGREWVVCFAAATGDKLWEIESAADFAQGRSFGPRATPAIDGDQVIAVGATGQLLCLATADGARRWGYNLYDKYHATPHEEGLSPSPLIAGETLYVLAGTTALALDKNSGEELWRALDEPMNHASPRLAELDGRSQLLVLTGSNLVGLAPEDGSELWRFPQQAVNIATPVVGPENQIFLGAAYGFGCQGIQVNDNRPREVFKNQALASHTGTAVLHEGHLYGSHDRVGTLKCVEFLTGEEVWESRAPGKAALIIADGQMILITEDGRLVLAPATPEGFQPTAEARLLRGNSYAAPALANGRLYLRSDEELVCVTLKP